MTPLRHSISLCQYDGPRALVPVAQLVTWSHRASRISPRLSSQMSSWSSKKPASTRMSETWRTLFQKTLWNQCST